MFRNELLINRVTKKLDRAEVKTLEAMKSGKVQHEPSITDRMLGYIESELDGSDIAGEIGRAHV